MSISTAFFQKRSLTKIFELSESKRAKEIEEEQHEREGAKSVGRKDDFFERLAKEGQKRSKITEFEAKKAEQELRDCTFKPRVNARGEQNQTFNTTMRNGSQTLEGGQ